MRLRPQLQLPSVILTAVMLVLLPPLARAQSGTLQVPAHSQPETAPKAPAAAPRVAVQQVGPRAPATPVVRPKGDSHAQQPAASAAVAKAPTTPDLPLPPPVPPGLVLPETEAAPASAPPASADKAGKDKPGPPPLPLPRFASLRSDDVNMRLGPGTRYRIEWNYKRRDLPVQIEREFDVWRLIRDPDGIQGWVNAATLTGRRTFMVKGADATLRGSARDTASAVAILKVGVIGRIRSCEKDSDWCQVQAAGHRGYVRREQIWGLLPAEVVAP